MSCVVHETYRYRKAIDWIKRYEVPFDGTTNYTHSSLRGGRDPTTRTGRLQVPDDPQTQNELAKHIAALYDARSPATLVEMSTHHFPFVEDVDIEGSLAGANQSGGSPPDSLVHNAHDNWRFWRFRALSLHRLFPRSTLKLVLFSASGKHNEKVNIFGFQSPWQHNPICHQTGMFQDFVPLRVA